MCNGMEHDHSCNTERIFTGTLEEKLSKFIISGNSKFDFYYNYDKVDLNNLLVCITCPIHGDFIQNKYDHVRGIGCPKCFGKNLIKENAIFITQANIKHNSFYDYSKVVYLGATKDVCIICPIHGEFWQRAKSHLSGAKCNKCRGIIPVTTQEFLLECESKYKNHDYLDFSNVIYVNSYTPVHIICKYHGDLWVKPSRIRRNAKYICDKCARNAKRIPKEEFLTKAELKYGNKYDYSQIDYKGIAQKVKIICDIHGEFWQTPLDHLNDHGCWECEGRVRLTKWTTESLVEKTKEIIGENYDFSHVVYINFATPIKIICYEHGEFYREPRFILASRSDRGEGCPICKFRDSFISQAIELYGTQYDFSKVKYINSKTEVIIICKDHGEFLQKPGAFLRGFDCNQCNPPNHSKIEYEYLDSLEISKDLRHYFIRRDPNKYYFADAVIFHLENKILVEFDGTIWHGDPRKCKPNDKNLTNNKTYLQLYEETMQKRNDYHLLGHRTISIWEEDWKEFRNDVNLILSMKNLVKFWIESRTDEQHLQITKQIIEEFISDEEYKQLEPEAFRAPEYPYILWDL